MKSKQDIDEMPTKFQQMFSNNPDLDCTKIEMEHVQRIGQHQEREDQEEKSW